MRILVWYVVWYVNVAAAMFELLGRRTFLGGKPGVQGEASSPVSVFRRADRNKAAIFHRYATNPSK